MKKIIAKLVISGLSILPFVTAHADPPTSILGMQNNTLYYLTLTGSPGSNSGCWDPTSRMMTVCSASVLPMNQQWVAMGDTTAYIDLEYDVCKDASHPCTNIAGHVGISFSQNETKISNSSSGTAQLLGPDSSSLFTVNFISGNPPVFPLTPTPYSSLPYRGVNLSGAEFNGGAQWPSTADPLYFAQKGMNTIRLPFQWEYLQSDLSKDIDFTTVGGYGNTLVNLVNSYTSAGLYVMVDMHDYMRYNLNGTQNSGGPGVIGSDGPSADQYANAWKQIAAQFKNNNHVIFDLMNEPNTMATEAILANENAATKTIRAAGANNLVLLEGNGWSGMHTWTDNFYGTPNSQVFVPSSIQDPQNNYAINIHQYADNGGGYQGCSGVNGLDDMNFTPFVNYMNQFKLKVFLTEIGTNALTSCMSNANALLTAVTNHAYPDQAGGGGFIGWTAWASGNFTPGDALNLKPYSDGTEKLQMTMVFSLYVTPPSSLRGRPPPPPDLQAIREEVRQEINQVRNELHHFQNQHGGEANKARVHNLLVMELAVLQARLLYPTDDVLEQLEDRLEHRQFLGRNAMRKIGGQLNTRVTELQTGG